MPACWASAWKKDDAWWQVDLQTARPVSKVTIEWEKAYATKYRIQTSLDGTNWTDVATVTGANGGLDTVSFAPTSARYVRMQGVERATKYGYSIKEFGVFS